MNASRLRGEELARLRAELRATQQLITGHSERLRTQVADRQRESSHRCALSRSVLSQTHRGQRRG